MMQQTVAATREIKSQPRLHARISMSHLKPVETAINGILSRWVHS